MADRTVDSPRNLLLWGTPILGVNFLAVVWHLVLVVKVQPNFPKIAIPLLILVNLLPVSGLVAIKKQWRILAGILILVPLGIALVIGVYQHFVSSGTDNVFRMPPGDLTLPFQASAVLLAFLEVLGCWLGIKTFALRRNI